jgi:hypothetical protein
MALCESRTHREQDEESPFEVVIHVGEEEIGPFMPRDFSESVFVWLGSEFPLPNELLSDAAKRPHTLP